MTTPHWGHSYSPFSSLSITAPWKFCIILPDPVLYSSAYQGRNSSPTLSLSHYLPSSNTVLVKLRLLHDHLSVDFFNIFPGSPVQQAISLFGTYSITPPQLTAMSVPHACRPRPVFYRKAFNLLTVKGRKKSRGGGGCRVMPFDYRWLLGISISGAQGQINMKTVRRMAAGSTSPLQLERLAWN